MIEDKSGLTMKATNDSNRFRCPEINISADHTHYLFSPFSSAGCIPPYRTTLFTDACGVVAVCLSGSMHLDGRDRTIYN